ncbi:MAG: serine/threonine-protein kinase [Candidatus Acidiferrales bacterium]
MAAATTLRKSSRSPKIKPGEQLDHYRIDSVVSTSDVDTVYRATDLRDNKTVALKVPHPHMDADLIFAERFQRAAEIGRHLDHPDILKVFPQEHPTQNYMVMEWVDGQLLRQILNEEKKLSQERAVKIAFGICQALTYIHNHGIIHRDLRPEHVMVDAENHVKLIDFGLAAQTGARRITFTKLSQSMGSPEYISPEQVQGKRSDARSDLYALGVMLYEMVTGRLPFHGANSFEIMNARLLEHPVPPREIDPSISEHLQEVIYRAMEREPQYRYPNAHDLAFDLEHLDQVGVAARPELQDWRKQRTDATKKTLLYAAMVLVPIVIFALLFYFARR